MHVLGRASPDVATLGVLGSVGGLTRSFGSQHELSAAFHLPWA
jgi:hypothetical protein